MWGRQTFLKRPFWVFKQLISPANRALALRLLPQNKLPPPSTSFSSLIVKLFNKLSNAFLFLNASVVDNLTSFLRTGLFFLSEVVVRKEGQITTLFLFPFKGKTLVWPLCESLIELFSGTLSRLLPVRKIDLFRSEFVTPNKCSKRDCLTGECLLLAPLFAGKRFLDSATIKIYIQNHKVLCY